MDVDRLSNEQDHRIEILETIPCSGGRAPPEMSSLVDDTKIGFSCSARELLFWLSRGFPAKGKRGAGSRIRLNVQPGSGVELQGTARRTFFDSDHPAS